MRMLARVVPAVVAVALLGLKCAQAEANPPDACKLLQQSDLQALFPGRPVSEGEPKPSAAFLGPQYTASCGYEVRLLNPARQFEETHLISVNVVGWRANSSAAEAAKSFASFHRDSERMSKTSRSEMRVESVQGFRDEAFVQSSVGLHKLYGRKDNLFFTVRLPDYSPQSKSEIIAIAAQVAKRWKLDVGMVEAATPITQTQR